MPRVHLAVLVGLAMVVLNACAPDFIEPWEVTKPRHAAARVSIEGDTEGRTRPRPGETFSIRFSMMSPEKPQRGYGAALAFCIGTVLNNGSLACFEEIPSSELAFEIAPYEGNDELLIRGITVPTLLNDLPPPLDTLDRIGLLGTLCVDGEAERVPGTDVTKDPAPSLYRCVNNDDSEFPTPMPFTMSVFLDRGLPSQRNLHPSFACDENDAASICNRGTMQEGERVPGAFVLVRPRDEAEGAARTFAWPAWDASQPLPWDDCAGTDLPKVVAGSGAHILRIRFDPSDRETFDQTVEVNGVPTVETRREDLFVAHALTTKGGELDGSTSAVLFRDADADAEVEVEYTPAKQSTERALRIPTSGRLVRFFFTVRDRRGGVDFTTRELCLVPPVD